MKIRFATQQDIPAILALGSQMAAESRFRCYPLNPAKMADTARAMIQHPARATILLAERTDGEIVGMLAGYIVDLFFADVLSAQDRVFFVKPEARGSSAAMKLLSAFRKWAQNRKTQELNINMSVAVEMARFEKMMTRLGFFRCGSNFSLALGERE